jgi:TPP-dependent pyruvate/acetoin dehydrogenase alpha subunit
VTEERIDEAEAEASALIEQAVAGALAAPYPDPDQVAATEYRR